jgi:hypothetical protein
MFHAVDLQYSRLNQTSSDMLESGAADDAVIKRALNDFRGPGFVAVV